MLTEDFGEWLTDDGLHRTIVSQPGLSAEEVVAWCDEARREYYLRPRFVANKVWEIVTNPREAGRIVKASRTFFKYLFRPSLKRSDA